MIEMRVRHHPHSGEPGTPKKAIEFTADAAVAAQLLLKGVELFPDVIEARAGRVVALEAVVVLLNQDPNAGRP